MTHHLGLIPLGGMTFGLELHTGISDVLAIDIGKHGRRLDTGILKTLKHVDHIGGMHATRTCTAGEEVVGVLAKESDGLDVSLPRQGAVVFQEYDTLAG